MPDKKYRGISNLPLAIPDVPDAPTVSAADVGTSRAYNNGAGTVTFSSPTGGLPTSYSITTTPTTTTTPATSSPVTLTGLTSATSYTASITATNSAGTSTTRTSSSFTATSVPQQLTIGTPSVPTAQTYSGSANVSVPFTTNATGGSAITSYTVTSSSANTATGASSPILVSDTVGTAQTYTVTATNANGTSIASNASAATTPSSVPQAPTIGTFTDGGTGTSGTLSLTLNATGGSAITNIKYSTDGTNYTATGSTTSPITISGLTAGSYTFYVKATNANGDSAASSSVAGTVLTPPAFYSIATVSPTSGTVTATLSSIPTGYKSLQIRYVTLQNAAAVNLFMQINGDTTTTYSHHQLYGSNSTRNSSGVVGTTQIAIDNLSKASTTFPSIGIIDIQDYLSTSNYKTIRSFKGFDDNGAATGANSVVLGSGLWQSTSAITSISFFLTTGGSNTFSAGTSFALYGVN